MLAVKTLATSDPEQPDVIANSYDSRRLAFLLVPLLRDKLHARGSGCIVSGGSWRAIRRMQQDNVGKRLLLHMLGD